MKHPASILLLSLLVILAAGCKDKESSPIQEALGAYILQGQEGTFELYRIEKIDSTSFRTEFERRQNVLDLKLREETRFYENYMKTHNLTILYRFALVILSQKTLFYKFRL